MNPTPRPPRPSPAPSSPAPGSAVMLLVGLASAVVVLFGVWVARGVIGPLALGVVIVMICHPLRRPLERIGLPRWAATTAVILVAYAVLAAMAALLYYAGAEFVALVRSSASEFQKTVTEIMHLLQDLGLEKQASDALVSVLRPETIIAYVSNLSGLMIGVFTGFFFVLAYVIFIAIDGARYARATNEFGERVAPTMQRFAGYASSVRRYYVVNASFGLLVAVIDGLALSALGVPAPLVWAILAFITNFIPNIGFVLGLVPPALVALAVGGWPLMLAVIAIYCVVNVVLQVMVQPKFVADAVDLSLTLSFFSVIFWTLVIGPLGAILSIPLTLLVRALLFEGDPGKWWIRWLSGDDSARPPAAAA
ncbi:AI-2E family transporter [Leucobacter sp. HY1910]